MKFFFLFTVFLLFCYSFSSAQENFEEAIYDYNIKMGDLLYQNHDFFRNMEESMNYYKKALDISEDKPDAYWKLARILWVKQEKTPTKDQKKKIMAEARSFIKTAVKKHPQNVDIRLWRAIINRAIINSSYIHSAGFLESILFLSKGIKEDLEFVLEKRKDSTRAIVALGTYYYYLPDSFGGDLEKAIFFFKKALELSPKFHRANLFLARAYYKKNKILFAANNLSKVLTSKESEEAAFLHYFQQEAYALLLQYKSKK